MSFESIVLFMNKWLENLEIYENLRFYQGTQNKYNYEMGKI